MTTLPMASDTILGSRDTRLFQPLLQLDGIEPEQVSPFEVRNAPLEHEAPDVPFVDVQLLRLVVADVAGRDDQQPPRRRSEPVAVPKVTVFGDKDPVVRVGRLG